MGARRPGGHARARGAGALTQLKDATPTSPSPPDEPVFRREGDLFVPTHHAGSPWGPSALHGGPPSGLMARAIERYIDDPGMQVVRLTIDLFRSVPAQPLAVRVESVRGGRRLHVVQASIVADGVEVSRTTALLLRRSDVEEDAAPSPPPPGPEGLEVGGLGRGPRGDTRAWRINPGFHTSIEAAWVSEAGDPAPTVWVRIPMPFVEGEETTPVVRAAALADFGNALANMVGRNGAGEERPASYINPDITLYMHREPVGEWLCLQPVHRTEADGIGRVETLWYDRLGRFGITVQARLFNPREPWGVTASTAPS